MIFFLSKPFKLGRSGFRNLGIFLPRPGGSDLVTRARLVARPGFREAELGSVKV